MLTNVTARATNVEAIELGVGKMPVVQDGSQMQFSKVVMFKGFGKEVEFED